MLSMKNSGLIVRFGYETERKVGVCSRCQIEADSRVDPAEFAFTPPFSAVVHVQTSSQVRALGK